MHIYIEGFTKHPLTEDDMKGFLNLTTKAIGMKAYDDPYLLYFAGGWSGIQMIAESHISIHAIKRQVWVDILSCKYFSPYEARRFIINTLRLEHVETFINDEWGVIKKSH